MGALNAVPQIGFVTDFLWLAACISDAYWALSDSKCPDSVSLHMDPESPISISRLGPRFKSQWFEEVCAILREVTCRIQGLRPGRKVWTAPFRKARLRFRFHMGSQ